MASKRGKRYRETNEYAAMMVRLTKAFRRRVGDGDAANLPLLAEFASQAADALTEAVADNYVHHAYSWTDIGRELGISRQAARQRFGAAVAAAQAADSLAVAQ